MKFALTQIKPRRRPTWFGWLLISMLFLGLFYGFVSNIYSFLAPNTPPHKGLMVVEGWIHDSALDEAIRMYRSGNYSKIVCTGVPIETGSFIQKFKSYPEMTATRLKKRGIPDDEIITIIGDDAKKDRTYFSAVALRKELISGSIEHSKIHLVTIGPHGRRSRLLFQKALGDDYTIGVTSLEDAGYDPNRWYAYSQGVRTVISECIGYAYIKLFFHP